MNGSQDRNGSQWFCSEWMLRVFRVSKRCSCPEILGLQIRVLIDVINEIEGMSTIFYVGW